MNSREVVQNGITRALLLSSVGESVWIRARGDTKCYSHASVVPATATATAIQPYRKPSAKPAENPAAEGTAEV